MPVLIGDLGVPAVRGSSDSFYSITYPRIAMGPSGSAVVLWANDTLWANRFTPGIGWATPTASPWDPSLLSNECCFGLPWSLRVVTDGRGGAVMVWGGPKVWAGHYVLSDGWREPVLLSSNASKPQIAADEAGNTIVAVWSQGEVEDDGFWRSRSIGASRFTPETGWSAPSFHQLPGGEVMWFGPRTGVASDGTAVVAWTRIYGGGGNWTVWAASLAADMTWSEGFELEERGRVAMRLAVHSGGAATVLYCDLTVTVSGCLYLEAARFVPSRGWEAPSLVRRAGEDDADGLYDVGIVGDATGRATVVWWGDQDKEPAVWARQSAPNGSWATPTRLSDGGVNVWGGPAIAGNSAGDLVIAWTQYVGEWDYCCDPAKGNKSKSSVYASENPALMPRFSRPQDGSTTSVPTVTVAGRTKPGATLVVNGLHAAIAADGSFSFLLALEEGTNTITAFATDASGKTATSSVEVTYLNPVHSLEEALRATNEALADAQVGFRATNEALADAQQNLDAANRNVLLLFVLQAAFAASAALLFGLYWQHRRSGPKTGLSFWGPRNPAATAATERGWKTHPVTTERIPRLTGQSEGRLWPKTPGGSPLHLTVKERVALHLLDYARHAEAAVVPPQLTQDGIAKAGGFNRRHFAQNVRPLVREGLVEERTAHVEGALQRQKVYSLTYDGWRRALGVRNRILSVALPVKDDSAVGQATIEDVLVEARGSKSLLDVVRDSLEPES